MDNQKIILNVENLNTTFISDKKEIKIVKNVSFQVKRGKALAVVGESGCGKSVTMNSIMRFLGKNAIVKADKTERKNPKEVYTARNTFAQTEEGLVNVAALKAKLAEVGKLDENLYTKDSWKELQDAVKNAEAYLENGTKDQVDKAVSDLENAVNGLVEKTEDRKSVV